MPFCGDGVHSSGEFTASLQDSGQFSGSIFIPTGHAANGLTFVASSLSILCPSKSRTSISQLPRTIFSPTAGSRAILSRTSPATVW